jgi:hypothetical protein
MDDGGVAGMMSLFGLAAAIGILITANWMWLAVALFFGLIAGGIAAGDGDGEGFFCGIAGCLIIVFLTTLIPGFVG